MKLRFFACVLLLSIVNTSWAWGRLGHEIVCEIAWLEMTPKAKSAVEKLLAQIPPGREVPYDNFAQACTWADFIIHSDSNYAVFSPLHFINVSRDAAMVLPGDCDKSRGCVTEAIRSFRTVLAGGVYPKDGPGAELVAGKLMALSMLGNLMGDVHQPLHVSYAEDMGGNLYRRLIALLMLGHFVGDIHQPLHVSYEDDMGGNLYKIYYDGKATNLHLIWDNDLITQGDASYQILAKTYLKKITPGQSREYKASNDPDIWATESLRITRKVYHQLGDTEVLPEGYYGQWHPFVVRRLQAAGVRLAKEINTIFNN